MGGVARIGISGWRYPPWRGTFYPEDLPQKRELAHASRALPTIEINGTFYSLQRASSFRAWREQTPDGFMFAVKGGRYITHMLRLRDCEKALGRFFAQGVRELGDKLGPILWQLPPWLQYDGAVLEHFLDLLPRDLRHVLEPRHESFFTRACYARLARRNVALCVSDNAKGWPHVERRTADFMYARLHGRTLTYASGYSSKSLDEWAAKVRRWKRGGDVFIYFDNDSKIRAPYDAINLRARLEGTPTVPFPRAFHKKGEPPRPPQPWRFRARGSAGAPG